LAIAPGLSCLNPAGSLSSPNDVALRHIHLFSVGFIYPAMGNKSIAELREQIDAVDEELIKLLAQRQRLVEAVLVVKKRDGVAARIPSRVDYVIDRARVLARAHHLDPALAETIWTEMIEWFVAHEERTLDMK
jgi:isochorismate pyruvate lyase